MTLAFSKVEGLGNDFVIFDLRRSEGSLARSAQESPVVRRVCDRHFGVGADGVLAILPSEQADARMRVLNADGSEAEMCGNGLRCVAKFLYETDPTLRRSPLRVETGAGVLTCSIDSLGGEVRTVTVEMGQPRLARRDIPMSPGGAERAIRVPVDALGRRFDFTCVSMGNPHAVTFVSESDAGLRDLAETFGPAVEHAAIFPNRTNVELARIRDAQRDPEIDLVVWERGCGITLACGTGACATVVAACLEERLPAGREIAVNLPGGTLYITVAPDYSGVRMRGPATNVFKAEVDLERLGRTD